MNETANLRSAPCDAKQPCRLAQCDDLCDDRSFASAERRFAPGDRVRVFCGVLAGVEGTVLIRRGESRLMIAVDLQQPGVSLEVDDASLEPIE
ncbi:MAG TPA: hypothetical protein VMV10_15855 [Pirellulales bacterium]|nr:hypothetical protein [Pirellulales bacterium]